MPGVCHCSETKAWLQDQWSFVYSNFGLTLPNIWQIGEGEEIYQNPTVIVDASELPDTPLVVIAPEDGKYIQGTESLISFEHPEHCIYIFGRSHGNLSEEELGGRDFQSVFIPTVKHEMYAHCAAYITLWDRLVKHG